MLAYAAHRRQRRRLSPSALALIVGGHAVAIVLLASAKMEVGVFEREKPLILQPIPLPQDPPPPPPPPAAKVEPAPSPPMANLSAPPRIITLPLERTTVEVPGPAAEPLGPTSGNAPLPLPQPRLPLAPVPSVKSGPRLATAGELLRPPYPESKRRMEEEATLQLRLAIDERGRVTAVEPLGRADEAFVDSARRHLIRNWRYKPATEDGRPVPSSLTITLRFRLEEA